MYISICIYRSIYIYRSCYRKFTRVRFEPIEFTDKFVYIAHHFILLRLYPFDVSVDREGW